MIVDRLKFENALWVNGVHAIAGVDEVGRGCIAGPLVTAAVVLNKQHILAATDLLLTNYLNIRDSKLLSPKKRSYLAEFIKQNAISYSIEVIEVDVLDEIGISQATQVGFFNSIKNLTIQPQHILTDAFQIKGIKKELQTNIQKGDNLSITIAASSIIAKVYRDALMVNIHGKHQKYGFDKHKGYGTKAHLEAVAQFGPCSVHRTSFEPIKSYLKSLA